MGRELPLPAATLRLFPDDDPSSLADPAHLRYLIARVLEAGDRADLAWLFARYGEPTVADVVRADGARRLDRRNRWFWSLALDVPLAPGPPGVPWPLH